MKLPTRVLMYGLVLLLPTMAAWWGVAEEVASSEAGRTADAKEPSSDDSNNATEASYEQEVYQGPNASRPGTLATADPQNSGVLKFNVVDRQTGLPVCCRVNVVGSDGNYYEPTENPLSPWSLSRIENNPEDGPYRYYGWYFYSQGSGKVAVPSGQTRIEVWKGFEYKPTSLTVNVTKDETTTANVAIDHSVDMAARGWYSGDTHIHLNRRTEEEDERALDLAAAEDIRFAFILCMNDDGRSYQPFMKAQQWPQERGMGASSEKRRGIYAISSGQEYRTGSYGHICLIGARRLIDADGPSVVPDNWPVFGKVADEVHGLGGYAFQAHGTGKALLADAPLGTVDGVELLQHSIYRGIRLAGWYQILNSGFRFPAIGACDFPYCRTLGNSRTYAYLGNRPATFANWMKAAAEGRSFQTSGPLIDMTVDGHRPGETIDLSAGEQQLRVIVDVRSLVTRVDELQLIEMGQVRARKQLTGDDRSKPIHWEVDLSIGFSTWIAVRAFARSPGGREYADAHSNPVYVSQNGGRPFRRESVEWLLHYLDRRIAQHAARSFPQKPKVLRYYRRSRKVLSDLLSRHVQ